MMNQERSIGTFVTALLAAGLLVGSLAMPWFEYTFSSGRKTPPGGYTDPQDTRIERHSLTYTPLHQEGDTTPDHPEDAARLLNWIRWATIAAAALFFVVAVLDSPGLPRILPRRGGLALLTLALASAAAGLAFAWYKLPLTLDGHGVTKPFTSFGTEAGYTRTSLGWGWALAALSAPLALGALLFKFQTGVVELPKPKTKPNGSGGST